MSAAAVHVSSGTESYSYEEIKNYLDEIRAWTELCLSKMPKKAWVSSIKDRKICLIPHKEIVLHQAEDRLFWTVFMEKIQAIKTYLESDPIVLRTQIYFFAEKMFHLWDQEGYSLKEMKGYILLLIRFMRQSQEEMPIETFLPFLSPKTAEEEFFEPVLETLLHQLLEMGIDEGLFSVKEEIDALVEDFHLPLNSGFIEVSGGKMFRIASDTATFFEGIFGENFVERSLSVYPSSKVYIRPEKILFNEGLIYLASLQPTNKKILLQVLHDPFLLDAFKEHGFRLAWHNFLVFQNIKTPTESTTEVLELCFIALELFDYIGLKNEFLNLQIRQFFDYLLTRASLPSLGKESLNMLLSKSHFWGWERVFQIFSYQTLQRLVLSNYKDELAKNLIESFLGIAPSDSIEEFIQKITLSTEFISPCCTVMESEGFFKAKEPALYSVLFISPRSLPKILEKPWLYRGSKSFVYFDRGGLLFKEPRGSIDKGHIRRLFDLTARLGVKEIVFHLNGELFSEKTGYVWEYFFGLLQEKLYAKEGSLQSVSLVLSQDPPDEFARTLNKIFSVDLFGQVCVFKKKIDS